MMQGQLYSPIIASATMLGRSGLGARRRKGEIDSPTAHYTPTGLITAPKQSI